MKQATALDSERTEVRIGPDLLADPLVRDQRALDADERQRLASVFQLRGVGRRVGQLEVADLAELAVDCLVGDQPLDRLVAVERLLVQRAAGVVAIAPDEVLGTPLVAGVDDAAVPGGPPQPSVCASSNVTATPPDARTRAALIPA